MATPVIPADVPRRSVLRYFGGKWAIAPWVLAHLPPHRVYVEPFGGAASVLLRKPRSKIEVYNDLDEEIVGVFQVIQRTDTCAALMRRLRRMPYSRSEFERAFLAASDPIERRDAMEVIRAQDTPDTLFFVDPPYLPATRTKSGYRHELATEQHVALLERLQAVQGRVVLAGYPSALYDGTLAGWRRVERQHRASESARPRTEVLWINPAAQSAMDSAAS